MTKSITHPPAVGFISSGHSKGFLLMTEECEDSLFVIVAFSLSNEVIKVQNCISHVVLIAIKLRAIKSILNG